MLQSFKQLYGNKLGASDGDLGHVRDFYFDDRSWAVRYVVAETGSWLTSRQVLLSPHAFGGMLRKGKVLRVNLTRKQIEASPEIEWHKPISRQYEEEYHRYYGWPFYWQGDGLWGMGGTPVLESPAKLSPKAIAAAKASPSSRADAHLQSAQAVNGYHLQAGDGIVGQVCDFLMDDKKWAVSQLVVRIGHRFTGKAVRVPVGKVIRISYEESKVLVKMNTKAVGQSPADHLAPVRVKKFTPPEPSAFKEVIKEILAP